MIDHVNFDNSMRKPQDGVSIHAGFPNASDDAALYNLNLQQLLVKRPLSTFFFRISGQEWSRFGVFDGDLAVIDKALAPGPSDLVIWWHDTTGQFSLSRLKQLPRDASVWGCVTSITHQMRHN